MNDELKELFSHARTVHFTLLGSVFAMLVVVSLGADASLQRAADQLARVAALNDALTTQSVSRAALESQGNAELRGLSVHEERRNVCWLVDGVYHRIREAEFPHPRPKVWVPTASIAYSPPFSLPPFVSELPASRTLRDFRLAWQFLLDGKRAFLVSALHPENAAFVNDEHLSPDTPSYRESIEAGCGGQSAALNRDFLVDVSVRSGSGAYPYVADFALTGGQTDDPHRRYGRHALIPLETRAFPLDMVSVFLSDVMGVTAVERPQFRRPFSEVFRELSTLSAGLESLRIEELRTYFERLLREEGPKVELFGAKIPQGSMVYWSLPAILVLQVYLLIMLRQVVGSFSLSALPVRFPWIVLYADQLSKSVTWFSLIVAPVTALVVAIHSWPFIEATWIKLLLVIGLVGTLIAVSFHFVIVARIVRIANSSNVKVDNDGRALEQNRNPSSGAA